MADQAPVRQRRLGEFEQQASASRHEVMAFLLRPAEALVERLGDTPEYVVFGVVTEYCVSCAVKGLLNRKRRVAIVSDAIETLDPRVGAQTISDFRNLGARMVTTDEALAALHPKSANE